MKFANTRSGENVSLDISYVQPVARLQSCAGRPLHRPTRVSTPPSIHHASGRQRRQMARPTNTVPRTPRAAPTPRTDTSDQTVPRRPPTASHRPPTTYTIPAPTLHPPTRRRTFVSGLPACAYWPARPATLHARMSFSAHARREASFGARRCHVRVASSPVATGCR